MIVLLCVIVCYHYYHYCYYYCYCYRLILFLFLFQFFISIFVFCFYFLNGWIYWVNTKRPLLILLVEFCVLLKENVFICWTCWKCWTCWICFYPLFVHLLFSTSFCLVTFILFLFCKFCRLFWHILDKNMDIEFWKLKKIDPKTEEKNFKEINCCNIHFYGGKVRW